ncbi:MAG: hypothetical protein ACHP6H_05055, partial [Legionellales bacterium]
MATSDHKLKFVLAMTKHALDHVQHLDAGGTVLGGPSTTPGAPGAQVNTGSGAAAALGINNGFQAAGANIQAGTNQAQLNQAYTGAQTGLEGLTNLAGTLTPQAASGVASQNQLAAQLQQQAQGQGPN